jgi:hypothetical protein
VGERLELDVVVTDILVLWDTSVVGEILELVLVVGEALVLELEELVTLSDTTVVALALDEVVGDRLELKLLDIDIDGELDVTDPAPTATNAMFVDCIQLVTVAGSVSPTV